MTDNWSKIILEIQRKLSEKAERRIKLSRHFKQPFYAISGPGEDLKDIRKCLVFLKSSLR
jgi:hypothetical protein